MGLLLMGLNLFAQKENHAWFTDLTEAKTFAAENGTDILMVFAGSDWCRPCIQFKQDILHSDEFKKYAEGRLAVLYLDFPARKKNRLPEAQTAHNEALAERYNRTGAFPKIVLLDKDENVLAEPEFKGQTASSFIQLLEKSHEVK